VYAELGEIAAGQTPGRRSHDDVFVFDRTGMALQDVAAAALVYQRGLARHIGRRVAINEQRSPTPSFAPILNLLAGLRHRV
jgi:alanine dehydrogenase